MQQGNVIFGVLLLAYLVYIVQRGELSSYLTLLRGGGQEEINQAQTSTGLNMLGSSLSSGLSNTNIGSLFSGAPAAGNISGADLTEGEPSPVGFNYNLGTNAGASQAILDVFGGD